MSKSTVTRSGKSVDPSPLASAKAEALRAYLAHRGGLRLADDAYRKLRWATGLSRGEIQRAVDLLAIRGVITIETSSGCLAIRLIEQAAKESA